MKSRKAVVEREVQESGPMLERALALHRQGRLDDAAALYWRMLAVNPRDADARHLLGVIEYQTGRAEAAAALISQAIEIDPNRAVFRSNLGLAFHAMKQFDAALASYARALAIDPRLADALNLRGNVFRELKHYDEALADYAHALSINARHVDALNNRGVTLNDLGRFEAALASFDRAIAIDPGHAEALNNRGVVLSNLKRFAEAIASYERALALKPDYAEALNNRGNALCDLRRFDEALRSFDEALASRPGYADAHHNKGTALSALRRFEDAIASYDCAIVLNPRHAAAFNNRGNAFMELKRFEEALASYEDALALRPDYPEALRNRGNALCALDRFEEAIAAYDRALALRPDYEFLLGQRMFCKLKICDWPGAAADFAVIAGRVEAGEAAAAPSEMLATSLPGALQKRCAETYLRKSLPADAPLSVSRSSASDRLKIGYFSSDFHEHATAYLIAGLIEQHDRAKFETLGFSFGPQHKDAMRARLEKAFDRFLDVGALSDRQIASLARKLEVDIAVDLKGFTQDSRPGIFAHRAAPLQVSYLGYPGTMGAGFIDYLIADATLIAEHEQIHYREKIVYLPDSYQVNDAGRPIAARRWTRRECGLPEEAFVFCCFNGSYKIAPDVFDVWMRLLKTIDASVLWLYEDNPSATRNLRRAAAARGVSPERLVFAKKMALPLHLSRHAAADLFLDTLPYNAHTTASDALWAGLPIITCAGPTFPGRVAASLLTAVGLPELITDTLNDYEMLAVDLARDPERLRALRQRLAAHRLTCPLFDTTSFARRIESGFAAMWQRRQAGLAPEHIHVKP